MQMSPSQNLWGFDSTSSPAVSLGTLGQSLSLKKDLKTDQNAISNTSVFRILEYQTKPTDFSQIQARI